MALHPSPIVALNRAIAVAHRDGPKRGLEAIGAIEDRDRLAAYPFYLAAIGELELRSGNYGAARQHFQAASTLARNSTERRFLDQRIAACDRGETAAEYYEEFWNGRLDELEGQFADQG